MRTRRLLAPLFLMAFALVAAPAAASSISSGGPWLQFQGDAGRTGFSPQAPAPPYTLAWEAATGLGDATHVSGLPVPVLTDTLAIVVGREEVTAVQIGDGSAAWTLPRALGPSSPPAVTDDELLYLEGGGDESASASATPSASTGPSATPSTSASRSASASSSAAAESPTTTTSTLVAIDLATRKRLWTMPLSDVSHTGVLVTGDLAIVGADDGTITAASTRTGEQVWSVDVGDHVLPPMSATGDLVFASVRPELRQTATLVALQLNDGSQRWRYEPSGTVLDLGASTAAGDTVYVVASDSTIRAVSTADGSQRWAASLYSPTAGSPPAVSDQGVFVTDQSGTVYSFDPSTGAERWRFATNLFAVSGPIVTPDALLQPTSNGTIVAIDVASGHQIWHASASDSVVIGLAATPDLIVATRTGSSPGLVAFAPDATAATEDITSPTTADPVGLMVGWLAAAVPITVALALLGRPLYRKMGSPDLATDTDDDIVDPWESDPEDEA